MNKSGEGIDTLLKAHSDALSRALLALQFVEECMRMYLGHCYGIITARVANVFVYSRTYADIRKKSMGQLLQEFRQFCGDQELVSSINALVKDRNFCAHEAFLLTIEEMRDATHLVGAIEKILDIHKRADACLRRVLAVGQAIQNS